MNSKGKDNDIMIKKMVFARYKIPRQKHSIIKLVYMKTEITCINLKMKSFFVVLLAAATISLVISQQVYSASELAEWNSFKTQHGKTYDAAEDSRRLQIYMDNKNKITQHNTRYAAGQETFTMAINQFTDQLPEELSRGFRRS